MLSVTLDPFTVRAPDFERFKKIICHLWVDTGALTLGKR